MQDLLVGLLLVSGMLALGTVVDAGQLVRRVRRPGGLLVVLAVNLVAVPALGLLLVRVVELDPPVALGLVLAAAAPGGGTGALLALHARGDVPTAVVLQVLLAALSLLVTPLWLALHAAGAAADVDVAPLVVALLVLQLGPLAGGALLARRRPTVAARVHALARRTADVSLVVLVVGLTVTQYDELDRVGGRALLLMALLVLATLATLALPVGPAPVRRAAALTTAVRNLSLALLAASYADDPPVTALAVLAYGLLMYVLSGAAVALLRRR